MDDSLIRPASPAPSAIAGQDAPGDRGLVPKPGDYNRKASNYDASRFGTTRGLYARQVKNRLILGILARRRLVSPGVRIVDVAAGTGRIANELVRLDYSRVFLTDIAGEMLKTAVANCEESHRGKLRPFVADMARMPFRDDFFDVITLGSFLYLIPLDRYAPQLADLSRVLKPGGTLICEVSNALCLLNPRNLLYVARHKHLRKRPVKSYLYPWDVPATFRGFTLKERIGIEYPLVGGGYPFHQRYSTFLGNLPLARSIGGKMLLVLENVK